MSPGVQIILSGVLTFGVPLMIAARELIVLRRGGAGSWPPPEPPRGPATPPPFSWRPSLPPLRPVTVEDERAHDAPSVRPRELV